MLNSSAPRVAVMEPWASQPVAPLVPGIPALPAREGWIARVEAEPDTLWCSRLDGEDHWTVDGQLRGSLPIFHNGHGSRCTVLVMAPPEVEAALTAHLGRLVEAAS